MRPQWLLLLVPLLAGCAALGPGPRDALLAGRQDLIRAEGDSLEQAWWTWRAGDLQRAGALAGGLLPESWQEELLDWQARQPEAALDSLTVLLAAMSPEPAALVAGMARRAGRIGRLLPDSLFDRLEREPSVQWRAAMQAGSTSLLTELINRDTPGPRRGDFAIFLSRAIKPDATLVCAWGRRMGMRNRDMERLANQGLWSPLAAWLDESSPTERDIRRLHAEALARTGRSARALAMFRALDDGRDKETGMWIRLLEQQSGAAQENGVKRRSL